MTDSAVTEILSLVAALTGVAAVIAAVSSATSASRSARAAEDTLWLMREEADAVRFERARRADPLILLDAEPTFYGPTEKPNVVTLTLGFRNVGNRPAERLLVNFLVPDPFYFQLLHQGGTVEDDRTAEETGYTSETLAGSEHGCYYWDADLGPLDPHAVNKVQRLMIQPRSGIWELKALLMQADIPGGYRTWRWLLTISSEDPFTTELTPLGDPVPPMRTDLATPRTKA
jgi:hypothetical protein